MCRVVFWILYDMDGMMTLNVMITQPNRIVFE